MDDVAVTSEWSTRVSSSPSAAKEEEEESAAAKEQQQDDGDERYDTVAKIKLVHEGKRMKIFRVTGNLNRPNT